MSVITFLVWAGRSLGEPLLLSVAAAMIWVGFIGPVLHETCHALAGRRVGLTLIAFGVGNRPYVRFRVQESANTPRAWAVMAVAGPASDLVSAACFAVVALTVDTNASLTGFCLLAGTIQACTGIYNLVPVKGNDGSIIRQSLRQARKATVEAVDHRKPLLVKSSAEDPDAAPASFNEEVLEQATFDDGYRGRLSESFASEMAKLHIGIHARLTTRSIGDASTSPDQENSGTQNP